MLSDKGVSMKFPVKQVTQNRFLNFFEIDAQDRNGKHFPYYMASRSEDVNHLAMNDPDKLPDGVQIFCVHEDGRVVLVRQYLYPVGDYVYDFPAGLVENGEDVASTAPREVYEETGLRFQKIDVDPLYERGFYTTDGLTDEACSMVFGYAQGQASLAHLEAAERLEVILADRKEARRILAEEKVSLMCAYMLLQYIASDDPFSFMRKTEQ